jgi:hypothetical protein
VHRDLLIRPVGALVGSQGGGRVSVVTSRTACVLAAGLVIGATGCGSTAPTSPGAAAPPPGSAASVPGRTTATGPVPSRPGIPTSSAANLPRVDACRTVKSSMIDHVPEAHGVPDPLAAAQGWRGDRYPGSRLERVAVGADHQVIVARGANGEIFAVLVYTRGQDGGWLMSEVHSC